MNHRALALFSLEKIKGANLYSLRTPCITPNLEIFEGIRDLGISNEIFEGNEIEFRKKSQGYNEYCVGIQKKHYKQ